MGQSNKKERRISALLPTNPVTTKVFSIFFIMNYFLEVKLNFYMQSKSRDVAHKGSTMKIDYNTRFLLAVRRKRKIIGYFIGHSEATARDGFHLSKHHATFA